MKKVSIIVPIYNTRTYLKDCIESVLSQTYSNLELILIDDGSTDDSVKICREYLNDSRVKFIQKKNGGVSSARNRGIEEATGDFIMFVDSDDYIEPNMIEQMINTHKKYQMVFCGYNETYVNSKIKHFSTEKKYNGANEIINDMLYSDNVAGFLCNKIFDSKIIKKYNLKLDENLKYCEDLLFNVEYLLNVKNAVIIPNCLYNYRMRNSSATWNIDSKKAENLLICFKKLDILLKSNDLYNHNYIYYKLNLLYKYSLPNIKKMTKSEFNILLKSKEISLKRKIKLIIMRNFKFIYIVYMNNKVKNNILFD